MFIEFKSLEDFLKVATRYNTLRVYRVIKQGDKYEIECLAQSIKNTYYLYLKELNEDKMKAIVNTLLKYDFIEVKEIRRWEG